MALLDPIPEVLVELLARVSKRVRAGLTRNPQTESALGRAQRDFPAARSTGWFYVAAILAGGISAAFAYVLAEGMDSLALVLVVTFLGVAAGPILVLILVFCWLAVRAPYRQRDEAREHRDRLIEEGKPKPQLSGSEIVSGLEDLLTIHFELRDRVLSEETTAFDGWGSVEELLERLTKLMDQAPDKVRSNLTSMAPYTPTEEGLLKYLDAQIDGLAAILNLAQREE